jgi:DNA helicase II / ATP-dependent DNA helicase PcrA
MPDRELFGYRLRPQQAQVLRYQGGKMAVSAVPGSGKTLTLALLAARLIAGAPDGSAGPEITADSEVLVVTVQNSAVENITQRLRRLLLARRLPPVGFHVCTLHKLAADILRERYDLAGVGDDFFIVDEAEARRTMQNAADVLIAARKSWWLSFLPEGTQTQRLQMESRWREETERLGRDVTKLCKHHRKTPEEAAALVARGAAADEFLPLGVDLYAQYVRYLQTRNGLDFDDLIWRAMDALEQDATFLANLRKRRPYILEDEAQDSSPLQESVLSQLCGPDGRWVRVGDPNQSINSTFTAADPRYFRRFCLRGDVTALVLPQSGRCGQPIIDLANQLVHWTCHEHPEPPIREMAFQEQDILPADSDDAQRNPPDEECHLHFQAQPFSDIAVEASQVSHWAADYVRRNAARTVAILCPAQWQGGRVVEALQGERPPIPFDDLLRSTPQTRSVARVLASATSYLGQPTSRGALGRLFGLLAEEGYLGPPLQGDDVKRPRVLLDSLPPQDLLFPRLAADLRDLLPKGVEPREEDLSLLARFAALAARWVRALDLPIDQLLLAIAQDLFEREQELAICHTIASSLRATSEMHPNWRLPDLAGELGEIARNRRGLNGLSLADAGYVAQPGRVVVTTMHKAKGLEWDAVYLLCVDSLEFPDSAEDVFRDEPYFMPGRAPAVEARLRLEELLEREVGPTDVQPQHGEGPLERARLEIIAERLRLLYVGITRARRDLALTCSEMNGRRRVRPALAMVQLRSGQGARGR